MAKYEDYVKDDLNEEINEAAGAADERRQSDNIPERFRGKSPEEIAAAYAELESLFGRQGQELGVLRKAVDTLSTRSTQPTEQPAKAPERKPVTVDEIYDNADESIRRVVREESQSRIEELEQRLQMADRRAALAVFEAKHPDYRNLVQDSAFTDWIKGSPYRVRQAVAADAGDLDAADELFSTYAEVAGAKKQQNTQGRRAAVREAALETSGGSAPASVEKFSRSKLESMRIRARRGDPEAERYMQANGEDILRAYAEGRITN